MDIGYSSQEEEQPESDGARESRSPAQDERSSHVKGNEEPFTPAERIRELLAIDSDVTKILQTAGLAVQSLTNNVLAEEGETQLEAAKRVFGSRTNDFVVLAQSVTARLRRQVYALEEANIITANRAAAEPQQISTAPARAPAPRYGAGAPPKPEPAMQITNGGLGNLDVSWLNSRSDEVGKQKEAELWAQARHHLEKMLEETDGLEGDVAQSMEVDKED